MAQTCRRSFRLDAEASKLCFKSIGARLLLFGRFDLRSEELSLGIHKAEPYQLACQVRHGLIMQGST